MLLGVSLISALFLWQAPAYAQSKGEKGQEEAPQISSKTTVFDGIDFGDDSSQWANDNECDDPRFIGNATAVDIDDADIMRDASDCLALYKAGEVTLKPAPADIVDSIDFGDNSSEWANNNICDDPRFGGRRVDEILLDEDMNRDANDCRTLFLAGEVDYLGDDINSQVIEFDGILFGDNTSQWANDNECDDPRFQGSGMAAQTLEDDNGHDAVDCLALYQDGAIVFSPSYSQTATNNVSPGSIDFGDNSSEWANDDECDDPRFAGEGVATVLLDDDLGRDANDCRTLFEAGKIYLAGSSAPQSIQIDFGDNSGNWTNDGECDDPRFIGPGMATQLVTADLGRDAADCQALYNKNEIALITAQNVDFGDDESAWPKDGECDDPRFAGPGSASKLEPANIGHDATDCRALLNSGAVEFVGGFATMIGADGVVRDTGAPLTSGANIDWGDDSGKWTNDGECDDPRFTGPGVADVLEDENLKADATDCQALFNAGQIELKSDLSGLRSFHANGFDFGDNTSEYANNDICDDPRFTGPGTDPVLLAEDEGRDAADCKALFRVGQVSLASDLLIDFGDDSSEWANDGECDDPRFAGKTMAADLTDQNIARDASDCRASFELGRVYLIEHGIIDFGDDSSEWANDGECDDPRFAGAGAAPEPLDENLGRDASDCRTAYRTSQVHLISENATPPINFGDNSSRWANDGECDDPRFYGPGAADELLYEDIGHDAADCQALLNAGQLEFGAPLQNGKPKGTATSEAIDIDFGDDSSEWANDGECDDPRFEGPGVADILLDEDLKRDATDCRMLIQSGQVTYIGGATPNMYDGIDFGDDTSEYAHNQICDDLRFEGEGVDEILLPEDEGRDATDCRTAYINGTIRLAPAPTPISEAVVDFGDDSSQWANDGECDDPRFEGDGVADILLDEDLYRDATDCSSLFASGKIRLIDQNDAAPMPAPSAGIDFGDNTSQWANDNQCDDPRFEGEGTAPPLLAEDEGRDAADCEALFNQGKVQLVTPPTEQSDPATTGNIDFGNNDSLFANDNECDDPRFSGPGMAPAPQFAGDRGRDAADCQALFEAGQITFNQ